MGVRRLGPSRDTLQRPKSALEGAARLGKENGTVWGMLHADAL